MRNTFLGYRDVCRNPGFRRFWLGVLVSRSGDALTAVALAWLVLDLAGPAQLGVVLLCAGVPRVVTGPVAGRLLDRFPPHLLLGWDNALRSALVAVIPVLAWAGALRIGHVYVVVLLCAALSAVTEVGEGVLVPRLVEDAELESANSLLSLNWEVAYVVAPPVAGLAVGVVGAEAVLVLDAASFAVTSVLCFGLPRLRAVVSAGRGPAGFGVLFRLPVALVLSLSATGFLFLSGVVEVFHPVFVREVLGAGPVAFGLVLTAAGVGGVVGAVVGPPVFGRVPERWRVSAAIGCAAPVFGLFAVVDGVVATVVVAGVASFLWAPYYAVERSRFQRSVPDEVRGRVTGARTALCALGFPVGSACGGLLLAGVDVSTAALVVAGAFVLLAFLPLLAPNRAFTATAADSAR
ncbi:MFS transporter [Saccharothrix variisporea]|uniref:Transmembrane secretion effector n=1 Tax=Saccharothrix variisporea TaxID=543527 RepID=A0A495X0Y7_9PSEU|nr:MFS transporter [Saccharothrix variisporea]RKT66925.1 transmembrane secretion effector [Saccharothrix variisporea]